MSAPVRTSLVLTPEARSAKQATGPRRAAAAMRTPWFERAVMAAVLAGALVLWWVGLSGVDPRDIGDLGLVDVLRWPVMVGVGLVIATAAVGLRRPEPDTFSMVMVVVVLVVMLFATTVPFDETYRFSVVWRHAGVTDVIQRTGEVNPEIDAYFNWPAFFVLSALATEVAGLDSSLGISNWAPVGLNLLYLAPLVVIGRTMTEDKRVVWLGIVLFYLANWVGQDYYSPQGLGLFTFLAVIAALLRYFPPRPNRLARPRWHLRWEGSTLARVPVVERLPEELISGARRAAVMALVIACIAVEVPSHQLTPFALLLGIASIVVIGRCSARGLPVLTAVLILVWLSYMATDYLAGNLKELTGQVGQLNDTVNANVGQRVKGSEEHMLVVYLRLAASALIWGTAVIGALKLRRRGDFSGRHAALAAAPFTLAVLQPYGGEIVLRVYLFSLPFMVFFVAAALLPQHRRVLRAGRVVWLLAVGVLLAGLLVFTRYGNEQVNLFTRGEAQAVERMYEVAPPGSLLVGAVPNLPWQARDYTTYDYELLSRADLLSEGSTRTPRELANTVARYMAGKGRLRSYLLLTRSQINYDRLLGSATWGTVDSLRAGLATSDLFKPVFRTRDAVLYELVRYPEVSETG